MLATLENTKTYLGITSSDDDALLTLLLNGASGTIVKYIGREIEATDFTEYVDGNAQYSYVLKNYPVNSVTSIEFNTGDLETAVWEALDASNYSFDTEEGILNLLTPLNRGFRNYKIVYNAGYATVPFDLQIVCMQLAGKWYNTRNAQGIKSESVAGDSLTYDVSVLDDSALSVLNQYKNVSF